MGLEIKIRAAVDTIKFSQGGMCFTPDARGPNDCGTGLEGPEQISRELEAYLRDLLR